MNDYEARKQEKIERYNSLADRHESLAASTHAHAHKMADGIPFGQPILVGHHSEKRDRNYRDRIHKKFEASFDHQKKAEYYRNKAARMESNASISSDDPDAIELLKEKVIKLQKHQTWMKDINKIARMKIDASEKRQRFIDYGLKDERLIDSLLQETKPIEGWRLTNNNANIRRIKERIKTLERTQGDITTTVTIGGVEVVDNVEVNRLQAHFDGKPPEEIRTRLKSAGFRWSPRGKCWQSYRGDHYMDRLTRILEGGV